MLVGFIVLYMLLTLFVGVLASTLIKSTKDYMLAGRRLPLSISTFALFATWFGSETVLGAPSVFVQKGLYGVIEDPFGASLCLFLVGLLFAKPLYRMNLLTFGDFYRVVYGRKAEIIASFMLAISYIGWIAAQLVALSIVFQMVLGVSKTVGLFLGFAVVLFYTFIGGMWAVSLTDFIQTIMIIVGLIVVLYEVSNGFRDIPYVVTSQPKGFYKFFPDLNLHDVLAYISAWIVIGLGSIPQQDVFQRVMSARSERVAVLSSILGGFMYLSVGLIPLLIALFAKRSGINVDDSQMLLPTYIVNNTNTLTQTLFFGALLSAVMSTASGALLAPSSVLSENLIRPFFRGISDRLFLWITRMCVLLVALVSLSLAFMGESIYELVASSSALSLVSLFVPLVAGLFFGSRSEHKAIASMLIGFSVWFAFEYVFKWEFSMLAGLLASTIPYLLKL